MKTWTEIKNIPNPTEEEALEAINLNWYAISLISEPSEKVQKAAFEKNILAILYIKDVPCKSLVDELNKISEEALFNALNADPSILKFITNPNLLKSAIQKNWKIILSIKDANDELWAEAVRQNDEALKHISNPGEKTLIAAVENNWKIIQDIERPSPLVVATAVKQDYHALEFVSIKRRTEAVQLAAVNADPRCIEFLQRASEAVQMAAVRIDKNVFSLIKNPRPSVKVFCGITNL